MPSSTGIRRSDDDLQQHKLEGLLSEGFEVESEGDYSNSITVRKPGVDGEGNPAWERIIIYGTGKVEALPYTPREEPGMVINVRLDLDDSELKALKSYLEGKARKTKATRAEVTTLVDRMVKRAIAEGATLRHA